MYGTTAKYNKLQFAYDMMTPEDDWDSEDNELPTSSEMIAKYREVAITQIGASLEAQQFIHRVSPMAYVGQPAS